MPKQKPIPEYAVVLTQPQIDRIHKALMKFRDLLDDTGAEVQGKVTLADFRMAVHAAEQVNADS